MDVCFRCGRSEGEVRLFDGLSLTDSVKVCEKCSLIEGIPLLKNPSTDQLKNSEKTDYVYRRLKTIAGIKDEKQEKSVFEQIQELDENPELEKPDEKPVQFVENFHWLIQRERRRKGMTPENLAQTIGESASAIRMIERNSLPENALPVIKKIEQFFRVKLIESDEESSIKSPVAQFREEKGDAMKVLSFKQDRLSRVTISDLREMQRIVDEDFTKKTSEQLGKEQLEEFGKTKQAEKTEEFNPHSWSKEYFKKREEKKIVGSGIIPSLQKAVGGENEKVPTISELASSKPQQIQSIAEQQIIAVDNVPSIADLAERKGIRPSHDSAEKIVGNEIEIVGENEVRIPSQTTQSVNAPDIPEPKQLPEEIYGDEIEIIEAEDLDK